MDSFAFQRDFGSSIVKFTIHVLIIISPRICSYQRVCVLHEFDGATIPAPRMCMLHTRKVVGVSRSGVLTAAPGDASHLDRFDGAKGYYFVLC